MLKRLGFALLLMIVATPALAAQTLIVIGDSIPSCASGGPASGCALQLVGAERNIIFKSIASGGASLGETGVSGFNSDSTTTTLDHISGAFNDFTGIIIMAGTNDYGASVPWADMVTSMKRILDFARLKGKKVLVMEPIWRGVGPNCTPTPSCQSGTTEDTLNSAGNSLNTYRWFQSIVCTGTPASGGYSDICSYAHRSNTVLGSSSAIPYLNADLIHPNAAPGQRKLADWIELEGAAAGLF